MKSTVISAVLILLAATAGRSAGEEVTDFLLRARKKHADPRAGGLKKFATKLELRTTKDPKIWKVRDKIAFAYTWSAPSSEDIALSGVPSDVEGTLRQYCAGLWRELVNTTAFDTVGKAKKSSLTVSGKETVISCTLPSYGLCKAVFDSSTLRFLRFDIPGKAYRIQYGFVEKEGLFHRSFKEVFHKDKPLYRMSYGVHRDVNEFHLPTLFTWKDKEGRATSLWIRYVTVNGKPAAVADVSDKEAREAVAEFLKGWRTWDELEKCARITKLAEIEHDLVASTLAKAGLGDRSLEVRKRTAFTLGTLKRACAVPRLLSAMKTNAKQTQVLAHVIWAIGEIGDPRAVPHLSKGWWSEQERRTGYACAKMKIDALGNIRARGSVDAIIDQFWAVPDHDLAPIGKNILAALIKLTGQDLGIRKRVWKEWWKKNRATHRFD